ncbi:exo-alpha-sialidase [Trypanosoma cruzi]|nr:exo-alpha-sialidase [Trypanosoma cruzi]
MAVTSQKHLDAAANSNSCWPHHSSRLEAIRSNTPEQLCITSLYPLSRSPLAKQFPSGSFTQSPYGCRPRSLPCTAPQQWQMHRRSPQQGREHEAGRLLQQPLSVPLI